MKKYFVLQANFGNHDGFNKVWKLWGNVGSKKEAKKIIAEVNREDNPNETWVHFFTHDQVRELKYVMGNSIPELIFDSNAEIVGIDTRYRHRVIF